MKNKAFDKLYSVVRDHLGFNVTKVSPRFHKKIFVSGASVRNCNGKCCMHGTTASVKERDKILRHADIVSAEMTSRARHDKKRWFWKKPFEDDDFVAGKGVYTKTIDGACVFLRDDKLCALQIASKKHLGNDYALKPSVCLLWPVSVADHTLQVGFASFTRRRECCAPVREGDRTLLQVMVPDQKLITTMARKRNSRGGGNSR